MCGQSGTQWKRKCSHITAAIWPAINDHDRKNTAATVHSFILYCHVYYFAAAASNKNCSRFELLVSSKNSFSTAQVERSNDGVQVWCTMCHRCWLYFILSLTKSWNEDLIINTATIIIRIESNALSLHASTSIVPCCRRGKSIVRKG